MRMAIGGFLVALPFIAFTAYIVARDGWPAAAVTWGITAALIACVMGGLYLLVL